GGAVEDQALGAPADRTAVSALFNDLDTLQTIPVEPLDTMAARILLIHRWRRIVLRGPEVAHALYPTDLAVQGDARARVAAIYARLLPASELWLGHEVAGTPALPVPKASFFDRFQRET
ncbi:MAG: PaaX family transcriptional regulator C-terminal domain-containing protein, partial [Halocynthiibacter sp.]